MNKTLFKETKPKSARWYTQAARAFAACAVLLAAVSRSAPTEVASGGSIKTRQVIHNNVPAAAATATKLHHTLSIKKLNLAISLPLRNKEALTNLLADLYNPASPNFHHYLTSEQFTEKFGPTKEDYEAVASYAEAHGLTVTTRNSNRAVLGVQGTVLQIEKAMHVTLNEYQHPTENRTFFAPDQEPSLDVAAPVLHIQGLDNFDLPKPKIHSKTLIGKVGPDGQVIRDPKYSPAGKLPTGGKATPELTGSGLDGYYLAKDFRAAYMPGSPLSGSGQNVGVFELGSGFWQVDINSYESVDGIPAVPVTTVLLDGFNGAPNDSGSNPPDLEVSLDIEVAMGMAPAATSIYCYEGEEPDDVLASMASQNTCSTLSCSWGWTGSPSPDQSFLQMIAQGQSFFCAAGDSGAYGSGAQDAPDGDPNITMVGGTELSTAGAALGWTGEVTWPDGGGGIVSAYAIPSWQQGISMASNFGSTTYRNVPDVSGCAFDLLCYCLDGNIYSVNGTSCSTPMWAGVVACANGLAAANAQPLVGFLNPTIYNLGKGNTAHSYTSLMHDITSGNNGTATAYPAVTGYDLATGWGSPASTNLLTYLGLAEPLVLAPFTGVTFTGPVGGPFTPSSMTYTLTNSGTVSLNWSTPTLPSWLDVSPTSGTVIPGGASTSVTVTIDPSATNLLVGAYTFPLTFTDGNDNFGQTCEVILGVSTPPIITQEPTNETLLAGLTASFTVGIASNGVAYYQWLESGTNISNTATISGVNTPTLTLANVSPASGANYSVVVSNALGTVTSSNALLTISNSAPVIVASPTNTTVLPGTSAYFSVLAVGNTPYTYRWYFNSNSLPGKSKYAGTNTLALTVTNCVGTNVGYFFVSVSNSLGVVTSSVAMLNLIPVSVTNVTLFQNGACPAADTSANNPYSAVVYDGGSYYGTCFNGAADNAGGVFAVTTAGAFTTKISLNGADGVGAVGSMCLAKNGDLYGTAFEWGTYDDGTVFQESGSSLTTETTLTQLNGDNGSEPVAALMQASDNNLYGTCNAGGAYGYGTIFRQVISPASLTNLTSFNGINGAFPSPVLIQATDGNLYGTAESGGDANGDGTIYKISLNGQFTLLGMFNGANGSAPIAGLIQASDGNFYGTTLNGGAHGEGVVYQMLPNGTINPLYSFTGGTDGSQPWAGLVQGTNGNLYGACQAGGTFGSGTVFQISLTGSFTAIAQLDGAQGDLPEANLVQGPDGNLYGTCFEGGFNGTGSFFSISNSGPLSISGQPLNLTVNSGAPAFFSVATMGNNATYYQWQDDGTNLVNGGQFSGVNSFGLVISNSVATNAGNYSVIVSNLYGVVTSSLASLTVIVTPPTITSQPVSVTNVVGGMAFFSVTATGDLPLTYQWQQNGVNLTDGGNILGSATPLLSISNLTLAANGNYYSVIVSNTAAGATSTIATLTVAPATPVSAVTVTNTHLFTDGADGAYPTAALIQGKDGYLYGTASSGGSAFQGAIFRATLTGNVTNLYTFTYNVGSFSTEVGYAAAGSSPFGGLIQTPNGNLYGTCQAGGTNDPYAAGYGTLFRLTNFITETTVYDFTGAADGASPDCTLVLGPDGLFYGTAYDDGSGSGTIYKLGTNGSFKVVYTFSGAADGAHPQAGLILGSDGNFYGTATEGGPNGLGTAFSITTNGAFTLLATFSGANGSTPVGGLIQANDGNFYGTCGEGGAYGYGTVYRLSTNTGLTTIFSFAGTNGLFPYASLIQGKDGNLYGTASGGGPGGEGSVFLVTTNGALSTLLWFDGFNGGNPESTLLQASDGNLYGAAEAGGIGYNPTSGGGWGTLYRVVLPVFFTTNGLSASNAIACLPYSGSIAGAVTPPGDTLAFSLISGPSWLSVAANGLLSGTPTNSNIGTNTFVIGITDNNGFYGSTNLFINVIADPAPTFSNAPYSEPFAVAGSAYVGSIATNATAPYLTNGDVITYSLVSGPSWLSVSAGGALTGTPLPGNVGTNTFVVSATDLGGSSNVASLSIFVDSPPVFGAPPITYAPVYAGFAYGGTLATNLMDAALANGVTLTYSLASGPAWLSVAPNGSLSGTPPAIDVGTNLFAVEAIDSYGLTATTTIEITVNPNLPATIGANPLVASPATIGVPYVITVAYNAVETIPGDTLTFGLVSGPAWLGIAPNGAVSGTPSAANFGGNAFVISVTDLVGVTTNFTLDITVSEPPPAFSAPILTNAPAIAGLAYSSTLATNVIDAALTNGDTILFYLVSGPAWLNVATNGVLSGTPDEAEVGTNLFEVEVVDSDGLSATASLVILVNPDLPPTIGVNPLTAPPAVDGEPYAFGIATNAVETNANDTLTFAEVSGPAWAGVATDGVISGTPDSTDGGSNTVVVSVTDLAGVSNTFNVSIYVYVPPAFTPNPFTGPPATAGVPYLTSIATNVLDTNAVDTLTFTEISGPSWLSLATNGVATGTPLSINAGTNTFSVSVTDLVGLTSIGTIYIYVTAVPIVTTIATTTNGTFLLSWTGGVPPYQVQTATNLSAPVWTSIGPATNVTSVTVSPCTNSSVMFYQIQGN